MTANETATVGQHYKVMILKDFTDCRGIIHGPVFDLYFPSVLGNFFLLKNVSY